MDVLALFLLALVDLFCSVSSTVRQTVLIDMSAEPTGLGLLNVINNNCLLPVFRLYCSTQGVEEYLSFWLEVREFRNRCIYEKDIEKEKERAEAEALYKKYFSVDSANLIEVEAPIGPDLEKNIVQEKAGNRNSFDRAQRFVFDVLEIRGLKPFLQSSAYQNFLKREKSLFQHREEKRTVELDIKELSIQFARIQDATTHLGNILQDMLTKTSANKVAVKHLHSLGDRFEEYSKSLEKLDDGEAKVLAQCMKKIGSVLKTLYSLESAVNAQLAAYFDKELIESVNSELSSASSQKRKLDKTSDAEKTSELLSYLRDTNNSVDHKVFKGLCILMQQYLQYFEKGYALMNDVLPEIQAYRKAIQESKTNPS